MNLKLLALFVVLIANCLTVNADVGDFAINDFLKTYSVNQQGQNVSVPRNNTNNTSANDVDFTPYMTDLKKRIAQNFVPPRGAANKKIVVLFSVAKSGKLLSAKILLSSNDKQADAAALKAIANTRIYPLPPEFNGEKIDIQFTFDYHLFGNRQNAGSPNPNAPWYNPSDSPKYTGAFDRNAYEQWYKEHKRLRNSK